jgi:GTP-binding protein
MIEEYLHTSHQLKRIFLLVDIRHKPSANDKMMYDWIVYHGFEPIIVATKSDKIKRSQLTKRLEEICYDLNLGDQTSLIPFSAETKQGRKEIWDRMEVMTDKTQ